MERRFHAYGVGAFKSGTHSIAAMFQHAYRAAHEPTTRRLIPFILKQHAGELDELACRSFLLERDRALNLEMESNALLALAIEPLVALFPQAKFVLTIRDCYSFADSMMNHRLTPRLSRILHLPISRMWKQITDLEFQTQGTAHEPGEEALRRRGLHPIRGYLAAWAAHNQRILDAVPPDRLLVVRTRDIGKRLPEIAAFVGAEAKALDPDSSHAYRGRWKYGLLGSIDQSLLERTVRAQCGPLMDRFFPDIRSLAEAFGERE